MIFKNFRERVLQEMKDAGISMAELGRRMGTSRANIQQMLSGDNDPRVSTIERTATALGIPNLCFPDNCQEQRKRGPGRPPGPHKDYDPLVKYAADLIIGQGKTVTRALEMAIEWGGKQMNIHVSPSTLKKYFYKNRMKLLAAARRRLNPTDFESAVKEPLPPTSSRGSAPSSSQIQPSRSSARSLRPRIGSFEEGFQWEPSQILRAASAREDTAQHLIQRDESRMIKEQNLLDSDQTFSMVEPTLETTSRLAKELVPLKAETDAMLAEFFEPRNLMQIQATIREGMEIAARYARGGFAF